MAGRTIERTAADENKLLGSRKPPSTFRRVTLYALARIITIAITIVIGVFIAVLVANKGGQLDNNVAMQIRMYVERELYAMKDETLTTEERTAFRAAKTAELEAQSGISLPYLARHLRWTYNALQFKLGIPGYSRVFAIFVTPGEEHDVFYLLMEHLPRTLLLVGTADFLVFVIGIPLALYLSRHYGNWADKLITLLSPLSSVPSWVHGFILVLIFAVTLHWLPPGGRVDFPYPDTPQGYLLSVLKHMILPVTAIFLSLTFQLVYAWRNYFLIYSSEDYVDLAVAQGLSGSAIQRNYILKPTMPYVITSFALTLVSFWQMATALEVVFNWPGIGLLYIESLPNYWGETMYPGRMVLTVGVVVLFAYLLGMVVLLLDIAYALVDPRVRLGGKGHIARAVKVKRKKRQPVRAGSEPASTASIHSKSDRPESRRTWSDRKAALQRSWGSFRKTFRELMRYPSAVVGLTILTILMAGSLYAVIALPYNEIGITWYTDAVSGKSTIPKLAKPVWVNAFLKNDLPLTQTINSADHPELKSVKVINAEQKDTTITYQFDYPYGEFPDEVVLYFDTQYTIKKPFVTFTWITPDGREFPLKNFSPEHDSKYDLGANLDRRLLNDHLVDYKYTDNEMNKEPIMHGLFANPNSATPEVIQGTYTLEIIARTFEPDSTMVAELVVMGKVYGMAGTDYQRKDLMVPLLWGMPFALVIGLFGAFLTTIVSMTVSAFGVWIGGWADSLVQRITEANMILPVVAVAVLFYAFYGLNLWAILAIIVTLNAFGSPTKTFRSAFLQIKEAPYIEAAQAYGATNRQIIFRYMVPRILPVLIPQLVTLIPGFIFLEATLGMFNVKSTMPTWGKVIYEALSQGASWGSQFWVLEPIALLLLTGFAFSLMGFALDRVLNPRLQGMD